MNRTNYSDPSLNNSSRDDFETNLVSVIIPCFNGSNFLAEAIESVLSQSYKYIELVIVDDGSEDNSYEIVSRYPEVKILRQQNQGVASARNRGVKESEGKYLVFLDQDDRLLKDALEINLKYLKNFPDFAFVFGLSKQINKDGSPRPAKKSPISIDAQDYFEELLCGKICGAICPPSVVMFRRSYFEEVGGFKSELVPSDDYDLYF